MAVLVAGLVITGVLAAVTFRGHQRTEHTLLDLQTTLIADAGEAEDQLYVEDHLGGATTLAAATDGDAATFRQAMNTTVGAGKPFVTGSLWRLSGSSLQLVTEIGAKPLAPVAMPLMREAQASRPFFVTELETPQALHLAVAAAASGRDGTFIAYAEEPLLAYGRRITEPAGSPVAPLNLAVYLGRSQVAARCLKPIPPLRCRCAGRPTPSRSLSAPRSLRSRRRRGRPCRGIPARSCRGPSPGAACWSPSWRRC